MSTARKRILYGLQGDGRGHLSRAEAVLPELANHHDILIFITGNGEKKLSPELKNLPGVRVSGRIFSPKLYYKKNRINTLKTARAAAIGSFRSGLPSLVRGWRIHSAFRPDIIITDLEPCSAWLGLLSRTPFLTLDHQHILTNCRIEPFPEFKRDFFLARFMVRWLVPPTKTNIITTFFFPPVKKAGTYLFPPLLRREVIAAREKVKEENFILVYHTTPDLFETIDRSLKKAAPEKFVVYNMGREYQDGNVTYKQVSVKGFLDDLSSCKAVICNGGHTLICESIFLGKPVLSIPLKNNFEQMLNSQYLNKMGYGRYSREFSGEEIKRFSEKLSEFRSGVKKYNFCGNKEIVDFILNLIH